MSEIPNPEGWPLAATWEECAAHVEKGGVVEWWHSDRWRAYLPSRSAAFFRHREGRPGDPGWALHRLVPLPAEPAGDDMRERIARAGFESQCTDPWAGISDKAKWIWRHYADAVLAVVEPELAELRARLDAVPDVPDGCELVVLNRQTVDQAAKGGGVVIATACRAAQARRPKPEPETERVPWWEAVRDQRMVPGVNGGWHIDGARRAEHDPDDHDPPLVVTDCSGLVYADIAPDGTVEVLR